MPQSLRVIDETTGFWVDATEQDAPALHEAWRQWRAAKRGSNAEQHRWNVVLEAAQDYFDECGCDENDATDVQITPVQQTL